MTRRRKGCLITAAIVLVLLTIIATLFGRTLVTLVREGFVTDLIFKPEKRAWEPSREANLRAIYNGMKLHHDSEGSFPAADSWVDAVAIRIRTGDMTQEEAEKKLVRPDLAAPNQYGYAINQAVTGKYMEDLPAGTVLLFESKSTQKNASGDPKTDSIPGAMFISIEGNIITPKP
jgi:hypothetical protein